MSKLGAHSACMTGGDPEENWFNRSVVRPMATARKKGARARPVYRPNDVWVSGVRVGWLVGWLVGWVEVTQDGVWNL